MWWVGVFGCSCSSSSVLATEQCLGDVNMVWYGFSLWSLLRHDITEHILWAAGWASGQPYVSLQAIPLRVDLSLTLMGKARSCSSGQMSPMLNLQSVSRSWQDCARCATDAVVCGAAQWCYEVMVEHILWSQTPDVSPSFRPQGQSLVLLWTIRQMLLQHLFHGCDNTGEQSP